MTKVLSAFEQYAKMSHHLAFEGLMSDPQARTTPIASPTSWRLI